MAVAKLVCGACGATLGSEDTRCAACGETVEHASASSKADIRCHVCGHRNATAAELCQSCGARLGTEPARTARKKKQAVPAGRAGKPGGLPWQWISGAAVLALVGYLLITSLSEKPASQTASGVGTSAVGPAPVMPGANKVDVTPFELAVRNNPENLDALLRLGNVLHDNGEYGRAIDTYRLYVAKNPGNPDARVDLGICYFELGRQNPADADSLFQQALTEMRDALRRTPDHQPAAFNLGIVNLTMGNIEESNKWLARAVAINKTSDLGKKAENILQQHTSLQ